MDASLLYHQTQSSNAGKRKNEKVIVSPSTNEKNEEQPIDDIQETNNSADQNNQKPLKSNIKREVDSQLAQGGSQDRLNNGKHIRIENAGDPDDMSGSANEELKKEMPTNEEEGTEPATIVEYTNAQPSEIVSKENATNNKAEIQGAVDDEVLTGNDNSKGTIVNESEQNTDIEGVETKENDRTIEFPFLPLSQFDFERNEFSKLEGEYLTPKRVEIESNSINTFYVKVGYLHYLLSGYNDNEVNFMAGIGHDYRLNKNGDMGIELTYERQRNTRNTASFIQDLSINAESKRDAVDLVSTFTWNPWQNRFSITSLVGIGIERTSWDMGSTLFYPFSTVVAAENSNTIYMKPSPFLSVGGGIGLDILKNILSFHISVKYQYRLQNVEVNGVLQGYKINTSEYMTAYENIEERILEDVNFASLNVGLKFYIF